MVEKRVGGNKMWRMLIVLMLFIGIGHAYAQTGPVLDMPMDEGDGATVFDASGNGNDGTHYGNMRLLMHFDGDANDSSSYGNDGAVNGATLTTGVWGNGLEFDGVDDYVEVLDSASLDISGNITLSAWIKLDSIDRWHAIFWRDSTNSGDRYWGFRVNNSNYLRFQIYNNSDSGISVDSNLTLLIDQWYYVAGVYDGTCLRVYINGTESNSDCTYSDFNINTGTEPLYIGQQVNGFRMNGTIDEVAIYSKALSPLEIQDLYNAKKAKFTDWTDGKVGNALEFDGKDDYVEAPMSFTNDDLTVSAWVKVDGGTNGNIAFAGSSYSFGIWQQSSDIWFSVWGDNTAQQNVYQFDYSENIWYHVALTYSYSGDGIGRAYVNGILQNSRNISDTIKDGTNVYIGGKWPNSWYFNGTIDEVRIWNRALSEDEIYWQYHWNEYYPWQVTVPPTATQVSGSILWTGIDQNSDVELSLVSPGGVEYTRDSEGTEEKAKFLRSISVPLPAINYTVTLYSGYKRLKIPVTESGEWEFRVRSRNVTDIEAEVGWK